MFCIAAKSQPVAILQQAVFVTERKPTVFEEILHYFMPHILAHTVGHGLEEGLKTLPLLYLACLLIEFIETRHGDSIERALARSGRWGFLPASALGCIPQCGFSAVAANLYSAKVITLGTLMAVFLSTSDEAIPLLASMPDRWDILVILLVIKVVYAIAFGFLLDVVLRRMMPRGLRGGYTGLASEVDCHEEHEGPSRSIWRAALHHTMELFFFIVLFSIAFGLIVEWVGYDNFANALRSLGFMQPAVAALVGLIPNCAASVLLTQMYLAGALRFSSLVAGLCTGAGIGLAVLWRTNRSWKQNLFITGLLWAAGAFVGIFMQVVMLFV